MVILYKNLLYHIRVPNTLRFPAGGGEPGFYLNLLPCCLAPATFPAGVSVCSGHSEQDIYYIQDPLLYKTLKHLKRIKWHFEAFSFFAFLHVGHLFHHFFHFVELF
jgi:hypothetical protein